MTFSSSPPEAVPAPFRSTSPGGPAAEAPRPSPRRSDDDRAPRSHRRGRDADHRVRRPAGVARRQARRADREHEVQLGPAPREAPIAGAGVVAAAFRPPWWCRNGHLQTIWSSLFRRDRIRSRRERIATRDGDFVDLDWVDAARPAGAPLLLVLHGLEGSSRSHYSVGLMRLAGARGWRALTLNFRSCSGELNRLPQVYHSGHTDDLDHVVGLLLERHPDAPIGVVGVSLGGNVLLKWLGERELDAPKQLVGAVAISAPFDLVPCARVLDRGLRRRVYTSSFLGPMRDKVRRKAERDPDFAILVDLELALRARTFAEYDRAVTARLHGFADEHDYWVRASRGRELARVHRPTLLLSALDDPLVPPKALPETSPLPPWVRAEFTERGGHAGFVEGWPWRAGSWAERRGLDFLSEALAERQGVS